MAHPSWHYGEPVSLSFHEFSLDGIPLTTNAQHYRLGPPGGDAMPEVETRVVALIVSVTNTDTDTMATDAVRQMVDQADFGIELVAEPVVQAVGDPPEEEDQ
jgi:hypothetical protein